jgi:hypothetical protein
VSIPDPLVTLPHVESLGAQAAYYHFIGWEREVAVREQEVHELSAQLVLDFKAEGASVSACRGAIELIERAWQAGTDREWSRWAN